MVDRGRRRGRSGCARRRTDDTRLTGEALYRLVQAHGADVLDHVRGRFVMAAWTPTGAWVARDGAGTRALYVARFEGSLCFASELRLPPTSRISLRLRKAAVAQYLSSVSCRDTAPCWRTCSRSRRSPGRDETLENRSRNGFFFESFEQEDLEAPTGPWPLACGRRCIAPRRALGWPGGGLPFGGLDSNIVVAEMASLQQSRSDYCLHFGPRYRLNWSTRGWSRTGTGPSTPRC